MSGAPLNPALAPYFLTAGQRYRIPPAVLAGVADVETNGGRNLAISSTGAEGPMQFEPATAATLGINPNDPAQAIDGAGRYLNQLGYQTNPTRALASYNAGPNNYTAGLSYAHDVLSNASRLAPSLGGYNSTSTPTGSTGTTTPTSGSSYGGLGGFLLKASLTVGLVIAGLLLAGVGINSTLKGRPATAAQAARKTPAP